MGVDYDLFWTLNPKSLQPFIKAFSIKQKFDDSLAWTQGLYIQMAISSVMSKDYKYPSEPLSSKKKITKQEVIQNRFKTQMEIINARFGKEVGINEQ